MRCLMHPDRHQHATSLALITGLVLFANLAAASEPPSESRLFHKPGLIYFWALNDACEDAKMDAMIDAFAQGSVSAVCLHPRSGLLKPYGGDAWFAMIKRTVDRCAAKNLDVWLYDEDPFPSGNAGGWITMEHPEYRAMEICRCEPKAAAERKDLYCFPGGKLLWCGLVNETTGQTTDLTKQVGLVRRRWIRLDPWDSRFYYPATPLYSCPRAWTCDPEYAVEVGRIPAESKLLAFVANAVGGGKDDQWGAEPDRLNPEVTQLFIRKTHERYAAVVGDRFGKEIRAIFSDEPKYSSAHPWTAELFPAFQRQFGYALPPRLWQLFSKTTDEQSMLTRLHYYQWCGQRLRSAWFEPVSRWCRSHHLAMVGHVSPEDDPVQQVQCVGDLFPIFSHFTVPGFDLIIPAVGDRKNPLINIGPLSATSASQQLDRPGVLNEALACGGLNFTAEEAGRILRWECLMGVTTPVVHCAYNSVEGLRLIDAPPDFGPKSSRWTKMVQLGHELAELQQVVRDAEQVAPVAVLWPIRSFAAMPTAVFTDDSPLRNELVRFIQLSLDHQVGLHLLDEAELWQARIEGGRLRLGKANYSHVVLVGCAIVHADTAAKLRKAAQAGVAVLRVGEGPLRQQTPAAVERLDLDGCIDGEARDVVRRLPRLINLEPDGTDIRCSTWQRGAKRERLVMNLRNTNATVTIDQNRLVLAPGEIRRLTEEPPTSTTR